MRIYRRDDFDLDPAPMPVFRDERLRELVDQLPEEEQLIVSLRFFGEMTLQQIEEETRLSPYKVKGLLHAGLERLRSLLEANEVGSVPAAH